MASGGAWRFQRSGGLRLDSRNLESSPGFQTSTRLVMIRSTSSFQARAFTLVELLVSIAIVAILAVLILFGARSYFENAAETKCASNLRQLAVGTLAYTQDHGGRLPPRRDGWQPEFRGQTWMRKISPYLGIEAESGLSYGHAMRKTVFWCPSDKSEWLPESYGGFESTYATKVSYLANLAVMDDLDQDVDGDGVVGPRVLAGISRPAQTIMLMEGFHSLWSIVGYDAGFSAYFSSYSALPKHVAGYHRGRSFWAFVDGHVEKMSYAETHENNVNYWLAEKP